MNTYHITIKRGNTSVFTYNFDDQRKYTAHVDVNSEEMERCIQELRTKKRNIYSLGVIENKFELSMANLYVHEDFMFFIFDLKTNHTSTTTSSLSNVSSVTKRRARTPSSKKRPSNLSIRKILIRKSRARAGTG